MINLFNIVSGTFTLQGINTLVDSSANYKVNQFVNWYVTTDFDDTEYLVASNTETTITVASDNAVQGSAYNIKFVGRDFLTTIDDDFENPTKIPDDLIARKYEIVNRELSNAIVSYLRKNYTSNFNPFSNILNLDVLQICYANRLAELVYLDLAIYDQDYLIFKTQQKNRTYSNTLADGLALLQLDFNQSGEADAYEIRNSAGIVLLNR